MKKLKSYLDEMTMKSGTLDSTMKIYFGYYDSDEFKNTINIKYIADIDEFKIFTTSKNLYLIKNDKEILVGYFQISEYTYGFQLENIFIHSQFRGNKLFEKICWFIKRYKKTSKIFLGSIHSPDTVAVIKTFQKNKKFKISWFDTNTQEAISYDENLYSHNEPTCMLIMLENKWDHSEFPLKTSIKKPLNLAHCYEGICT